MHWSLLTFLFLMMQGHLVMNQNVDLTGFSKDELDFFANSSRIINSKEFQDLIKVDEIYKPPSHVNQGFNSQAFWRNYGIHFAIGAAISTVFSLIIVMLRLYKDSKTKNDTQPLFNSRSEYA